MQTYQVSVHSQPPNTLYRWTRQLRLVVTPKRLVYVLLSACLFVAAALFTGTGGGAKDSAGTQLHHGAPKTTDNTSSTSMSEPSNTSTTSVSSSTNGSTSTNLNVNGQDIVVPENGSSHQTIVSADGSRTTINTSRVSTGSTTNSSSSTVNINVQSSSSSSGGSGP